MVHHIRGNNETLSVITKTYKIKLYYIDFFSNFLTVNNDNVQSAMAVLLFRRNQPKNNKKENFVSFELFKSEQIHAGPTVQ